MARFTALLAVLVVLSCITCSSHTAHAAVDLIECSRYYRCTKINYIFALGSTGECECCPKDATSGAECMAPEGICYLRPPNCAFCGANNECLECHDGYELKSGKCEPIPCTDVDYCAVCHPSDECHQCMGGYRLKDNVCILAKYTEEECEGLFTCPAGTKLDMNLGMCQCCGSDNTCDHAEPKCPKHPDHCAACNGGEGTCTACSLGFKLNDGKCEPIPCADEYCALCDPSEECHQCMGGYRLKDNVCILAKYTEEECKGLFTCPAGTKLDMSLGMCHCCGSNNICDHAEPKCPKHPDHCAACNDQVPCTACSPGFELKEGSCDPIPCEVENCKECGANPQTCAVCKPGYFSFFEGSACFRVCFPENCDECVDGSFQSCKRCAPGYFLLGDTGSCIRVCFPEFCEECEAGSTTVCKRCEAGYTWNGTECV